MDHFNGSSTGAFVAVSAPAEDVASTFPKAVASTGYAKARGRATPSAIVSGVAALIRSRYPEMDAANVVNRILQSAVDQGPPGRDPEFGFGSVDAERALTMEIPTVTENPLGVPLPAARAQPGLTGPRRRRLRRAAVVLLGGLVVGTLLCLGLVGLIIWLVRRSGRRRGPPTYGGGGQPPPYPPPQHQPQGIRRRTRPAVPAPAVPAPAEPTAVRPAAAGPPR